VQQKPCTDGRRKRQAQKNVVRTGPAMPRFRDGGQNFRTVQVHSAASAAGLPCNAVARDEQPAAARPHIVDLKQGTTAHGMSAMQAGAAAAGTAVADGEDENSDCETEHREQEDHSSNLP